jgi:RNA polymerase sigma-70 factor (ECF subfamily)
MRPELAQAVDLLRNNTPEAVGEAIGLLQNTVYSFSMKLCGHREDAEDTTQEVLYRSLRYLSRIDEPRALAVWLYTVTRNRCWRMRKTSARGAKQVLSLDELLPDEAEAGRLLAHAASGPEGAVLKNEQAGFVQEAVLRLPPQLRIVLVLHDMEDMDTADVARILNLEPGTVRVRLHRARLTVRRELGQMLEASAAKAEMQKAKRKKSGRKGRKGRGAAADCRTLFANLSDYLDGRLEARTCEQMTHHIDACPTCIAFIQDLRAAIDRCRALKADCDPAVAAQLRNLLTREYMRLLQVPIPERAPA